MKIDSTRKAILYLTAVFAIGLAVGGVGGFTVGLIWKFKTPPTAEMEANVYKDLKKKLDLRPDQESEVKAAVHDVVLDFSNAFKEVAITSSNAVVKCQRRIEPVLDARQRTTLSNMVAEGFSKNKR